MVFPSPGDIWEDAKERAASAGSKKEGYFTVHQDRMGNIILEYSEEPDKDVLLQFEADKDVVYGILGKEEQDDLDKGWKVRIADTEPRASILEELWQYAEPKHS